MAALEARVEAMLEARAEGRVQQQALQTRLTALEQGRQALEARNAELQARADEALAQRDDLEGRLQALEARLAESEAARLELAEENRELDEQNREFEAYTQRLQARLDQKAPDSTGSAHRQGLGLSALMGRHRVSSREEDAADALEEEAASSSQGDPAIEEAPSPQALLAQWYQRYADAFFKGHTRPLKVGIHEELSALEPWPEKLVRRALACYVNLPRYLKSVREGAERIDLNGAPSGVVDRGAADHAHKKLERLQADRRRQGKPTAKPRGAKSKRPSSSPGAVETPAGATASPAPAAEAEPLPHDEPSDDRLQRKLGELMARHNAR